MNIAETAVLWGKEKPPVRRNEQAVSVSKALSNSLISAVHISQAFGPISLSGAVFKKHKGI